MEIPNLPAIRALRPAWNKGRKVGHLNGRDGDMFAVKFSGRFTSQGIIPGCFSGLGAQPVLPFTN